MTSKRIYLSPPTLAGDELSRLQGVLESGWIAPLGPELNGFENDLSERIEGKEVVGLSSGTAALHIALKLLGVGAGDLVWVSSMTFIASANAVHYVGATPVFVDSDRSSWCMDPVLLRDALSKASKANRLPKAIIPVDIYGLPASYEPILATAREFGVAVVSDAAESLGATYQGKAAGSFGEFAALSFNGNKIITTSGGGALICSSKEDAERARYFATQARAPAPHYQHVDNGFNYRLSNVLAALGRSQLAALDRFIAKRKQNNALYKKLLSDLPGLSFMPTPSNRESNHWLTCIQIDKAQSSLTPTKIRLALEEANIESRPLWKPMHLQPVFEQSERVGGEVCEDLFNNGLCLPSGVELSTSNIEQVSSIIHSLASLG